eukprot:CAMPEP_0116912236 /NCGR_PEP_ID=MMETSP0467-20121206/15963_1 /TAXON_ID=283647 /ORGANISM="Mesodinium pulex, Strain SPMC105" /LENGTH=174 /DNA_ID=CAMNT_0004588171 /DNA_START=76 /DNA_END=600 /DNA_ORIENTATION=-
MTSFTIQQSNILHLEAVRRSTATGFLELSALRTDIRLDTIVGVGVVDRGAVTEVADGLSGVLGAAEENGVSSLGRAQSELIQGDALATSLGDAGSSGGGELQSADGQLGHIEETSIISDGANDDRGLAILSLHESRESGDRQRSLVDAGHAQALLDATSEFRVSSSSKKAVQFN